MKSIKLQLPIAGVCIVLGFLLTYQVKFLNKKDNPASVNDKIDNTKVAAEIEKIKKEISDIEKNNNDLLAQIKKYEDNATNLNLYAKSVKDSLDYNRILLGLSDVQGSGIVITITPKSSVFSKETGENWIIDEDLLSIVNELNTRGAEAISINNKRITSQSGIKSSSGNQYILVNDEKVSPKDKIIIQAIGRKESFYGIGEYIKNLHYSVLSDYSIEANEADSIIIPRYNKSYSSTYIIP